MKKKGFTLIELLAIIVILAIIAVITVPLILNIVEDAKRNASIDSAYGYKSALEKYYMKKIVEDTTTELPNEYKDISELPEDFFVSGDAPSEGWIRLKKGIVQKFSLKYGDYIVTMDNDQNVTSTKKETIEPHVTNDYKEVEYLESTGSQYIDTGITGESKWEIVNQYTTPSSSSQILIGCGASAGQWLGQNSNKYAIGTNSTFIYSSNSIVKQNLIITFTTDAVTATIGEETKTRPGSLTNDNFYLLGGIIGSSDFSSYTKVYKANAYINDEIARKYVPVIRKSDNKPGMLDLANKTNNLIPEIVQGGVNSTSGVLSSSSNRVRTNIITIEPGKTYTIKSNTFYISTMVLYSDDIYNSPIDIGTNQNTKTFTVPSGVNQVAIGFRNSDGTDINPSESGEIMLNEGSTALPYEPYGYKFYTNAATGDDFIAGPEI